MVYMIPCAGYGQRIQALRLQKGLSLEMMAERLQSTVEFLKKVESSRAYPSTYFIRALADELDVEPMELHHWIYCPGREKCETENVKSS